MCMWVLWVDGVCVAVSVQSVCVVCVVHMCVEGCGCGCEYGSGWVRLCVSGVCCLYWSRPPGWGPCGHPVC